MIPYGCSIAAVMCAAMLHTIEAAIILLSKGADGSIGVAALLAMSPGSRYVAVAVMAASVLCASIVLFRRGLTAIAKVMLLAPQQALLIKAAISAWLAVWYADGVVRASITVDQLPLGMFAGIHLVAIFGLALFHTRGAGGLRR